MKQIPTPDFAGDDGNADPQVREALQGHASESDDGRVLAALSRSRVLIPVVARLGESETDELGLVRDKSADVAAVFLTGRDGRRALLAFTGMDSLQAWQPDARPVPVTLADAARSALHDGASAVVLDLAGPHPYAVESDAVGHLAAGRVVVPDSERPGSYAWAQPL